MHGTVMGNAMIGHQSGHQEQHSTIDNSWKMSLGKGVSLFDPELQEALEEEPVDVAKLGCALIYVCLNCLYTF